MTSAFHLFGLAAASVLGGALDLIAQPGLPDMAKVEQWQRQAEEQRRAQASAFEVRQEQRTRLQSALNLQNKAADLQRQVNYHRLKLDRSLRELELVQKMQPVDKELVASAQKDVSYYQSRYQVTTEEFQKAQEALGEAVKAYRESRFNPLQNKVVLPGEVLQVSVLEDESFNGLYQVRNGGYVVLPRVGRINVVGKDVSDAERAVKTALEAGYLKQCTVTIERSPGVYGRR